MGDPQPPLSRLDELRARWGLALGEPYPPGAAGYAVRAKLPPMLVRRPATQIPVRPAKVVQLEARRQARLEARRPTKPAA